MKFIKGRVNLAATIFVPYDCDNNCSFCTTKKDYRDCSNFSIDKIIENIKLLNSNPNIMEFVITGGEPFAKPSLLLEILNACQKEVYINTSLPNKTKDKAIKIINRIDKIKGVNISRHINFDLNDTADLECLDKIKKSVRINTVIHDKFDINKLDAFAKFYGRKGRDINLKGDFRKISAENLKSVDNVTSNLCETYDYLETESCMFCNTEYYSFNNEFILSYHRGTFFTSRTYGDKCYVGDIIIKQTGNVYSDWDCKEDEDFRNWLGVK